MLASPTLPVPHIVSAPAEIVLKSFKVGERKYQPADRFDADLRARHIAKGEIDDRTVRMLDQQNFFGPLTRHNYEFAIARREAEHGPIGRGFTPAFLKEHGIIDEAPAAAIQQAVSTDGSQDYRGLRVVPVKNGRFTLFEVTTPAGELLRAQRFRSEITAKAFIDATLAAAGAPREQEMDKTLPPGGSTESSPSDTPAVKEGSDGDDVQSVPDGSDLPGSPGDR